MRNAVAQAAHGAESEELLTTGEAAVILGSSRQHVVDLCNAGLVPYVTTGSHRRIRRRDIEAARTRTERPSRDQRRSRWLNIAVAAKVVAAPDQTLEIARANLSRLIAQHPSGQAAHWLREWAKVLDGPVDRVLEVLTSTTPYAREMRQNSPFAGILSEDERSAVLASFRDSELSRTRPHAAPPSPGAE